VEKAEEGDRDRDDVVDVGPEEVLADLAEGGAGELRRAHHGAQISLDEGDVRGFDRDVSTGPHGDADIRRLERGGVVDPVAYEGHRAALGAELPHGLDLVGGEQPGPEVVDAEVLGDGGRHGFMIAGEHHGPEAAAAQLEEGFPRVFLHRVGDRDRAEQPPAGDHPGDRARVVAETPLHPGDVLLRDAFLTQQPRVVRLFPVVLPEAQDQAQETDIIFEPDPASVLEALIPRFVEMTVYRAMLELCASEQSARMVAMRAATDNATELIEGLRLAYNKLRQARITSEIIDIASGANALADA